jgi:hypothetical protein
MRNKPSREVVTADCVGAAFSPDELQITLSALWVWRAQLGRVGSEQPIPGMGTDESRKKADDIARKLGGDPDAYFFGLDLTQRR